MTTTDKPALTVVPLASQVDAANAATRYAEHRRQVENAVLRSNLAYWKIGHRLHRPKYEGTYPVIRPLDSVVHRARVMAENLCAAVEATNRNAS